MPEDEIVRALGTGGISVSEGITPPAPADEGRGGRGVDREPSRVADEDRREEFERNSVLLLRSRRVEDVTAVSDVDGSVVLLLADTAGGCAEEPSEKKPSSTDQRLLRLVSERPTVLGRAELVGLAGGSFSPRMMGC